MERLFALFAEQFLDDPVAADSEFQETLCAAPIKFSPVAVITFFFFHEHSVSAFLCEARFQETGTIAAVAAPSVAIFTLFAGFEDSVAAGRRRQYLACVANALVTIALQAGRTGRAAAIDTARTERTLGIRLATDTFPLDAEATLTLRVRSAECAVAVRTLGTERTFCGCLTAFPPTGYRAAVATEHVMVVALFVCRDGTVSACRGDARFDDAFASAAIAIDAIRILTLFTCIKCSIAAAARWSRRGWGRSG